MVREGEMSKHLFRVAYDGAALRQHTIDVRDLAPSMLALGEFLEEANKTLNAKDATISLNVTARPEENCFDLGLELHQYWQQVKAIFGDDDYVAAKELVEWALVLGTGFWGVFKWARGRKPDSAVKLEVDGKVVFRYKLGEKEKDVSEKTHRLYSNEKIKTKFGKFIKPVISNPGIEKVTVYTKEKKKRKQSQSVTKEEAKTFVFDRKLEEENQEESGDTIDAVLRVYSPVYDPNSPRWRFWFGDEHHYMDVSESPIRKLVMDSGGALINDKFRVRLQITQKENEKGELVNEYKILDVLEFIPAPRQADIFYERPDSKDDEK